MRRYILSLCLGFLALPSSAQWNIEVDAYQYHIAPAQDSIYLQGVDNRLFIYLDSSTAPTYQYQLLGLDDTLQTTSYPSFRYTNLVGGEYEFKFKSSSDSEFRVIKVAVLEAIWQKWWFWPMIIGYVLIIGGILTFLFFQYNLRQKLKVEQLRNKIAADLHDEVGSNLSSISIYTRVLKKYINASTEEIDNVLNKINRNSEESVALMQDTVWAINPSNDTLEKLIDRIINFGTEILGGKGITFHHDINIKYRDQDLDIKARKNCYLILKEGINNIAKHSSATNAYLSILEEKQRILIVLEDDGKGIKDNELESGNGIGNFQSRAQDSGFVFEMESSPNEGTTLKLYI